jgi:putative chitinase
MTKIDWTAAQRAIGVAADGIPGPNTWRALFGRASAIADARPDPAVIGSLATAAIVHLPGYGILDSRERLAWLLAETCNETGGYARFEENLNYRVAAMLATWPSHFTPELAHWAHGHPDRVAEVAYGVKSKKGKGRMGNDQPGDGFKYRGRGMLQLTGKGNYELYDRRLGIGLDTNPEIAAVPALSLLIACEFYRVNGVLAKVDAGDLAGARRITNGGAIGLEHVKAMYAKIMAVLS